MLIQIILGLLLIILVLLFVGLCGYLLISLVVAVFEAYDNYKDV